MAAVLNLIDYLTGNP